MRSLLWMSIIALTALASSIAWANSGGISTREGPWLLEKDFDGDATLHARDGQTVLLRLEQGARRGKANNGSPGRNTHRLLVEEAGPYQFCIPADEPHIKRLKIREGRGNRGKGKAHGRTILQLRPGDNCESVILDPGSFVIETYHDHRNVPPGKVAFIRSPDRTRIEGSALTDATATFSFMTWKGPNGQFVTGTGGKANLTATATAVDEHTVWKFNGTPPGDFQMTDGLDNPVQGQAKDSFVACPAQLFVGPPRTVPNEPVCASSKVNFYMTGESARKFRLVGKNTAFSEDGMYGYDSGYFLAGGNSVNNEEYATNFGIEWLIDFRGFECASGSCDATQMNLAPNEVALFAAENYQGPAIVFTTEVADFSIYDAAADKGLAIGDNQVASIRVGPGTAALLYSDKQYGGGANIVTDDIPSLAANAISAGSISSMKVVNTRQYLIGTDGCAGCDLTGIDLSGVDLASADLTDTNLTSAKLTGTSFFGANLDDAVFAMASLAGTDFLDTSLRCTDFSDTDVRSASFELTNDEILTVTDQGLIALMGLDPNLGGRAYLSGQGTGEGVTLERPYGVVRYLDGVLLTDKDRVLQIVDGKGTLISSTDRGSGPRFLLAAGIAVDQDGTILVLDFTRGELFRIDPKTGNRTVISSDKVGSGPSLFGPADLAIAGDRTIYVTNESGFNVFAVDPSTGDRTVVSDATTGIGPQFAGPGGIVIHTDGSLLVTDSQIPALLRVDPASGDRTLVSGTGVGSGPSFVGPAGMAVGNNGTVLVVDTLLPGVLRIDVETGERTIVSGAGVGSGPEFSTPLGIDLTDSATLTGRIVTDFSCRMSLARSTLNVDSFEPEVWRYLDLRGASIAGTSGALLSSQAQPLSLSGAILNGVDLSGATLDFADFSCAKTNNSASTSCTSSAIAGNVCACLQGTNLSGASLKQASMPEASLNGALLSQANLDAADLTGAFLDAYTQGSSPANISGAFMRNVSIVGANLTGVVADNVNFYSIDPGTADATNANLTNAKFNNAYLAGANFASVTAQSTEWNQAVLAGANFTKANLQINATVGVPTDFTGAYLQGAVFTSSIVRGATFYDSYWDFSTSSSDPLSLIIQLPDGNIRFAGYWKDPAKPECVSLSFPNENFGRPAIAPTDNSNICPDDTVGPCSFNEQPVTPIVQATPKSSICTSEELLDGTCALPVNPGNQCTELDILWQYDL